MFHTILIRDIPYMSQKNKSESRNVAIENIYQFSIWKKAAILRLKLFSSRSFIYVFQALSPWLLFSAFVCNTFDNLMYQTTMIRKYRTPQTLYLPDRHAVRPQNSGGCFWRGTVLGAFQGRPDFFYKILLSLTFWSPSLSLSKSLSLSITHTHDLSFLSPLFSLSLSLYLSISLSLTHSLTHSFSLSLYLLCLSHFSLTLPLSIWKVYNERKHTYYLYSWWMLFFQSEEISEQQRLDENRMLIDDLGIKVGIRFLCSKRHIKVILSIRPSICMSV